MAVKTETMESLTDTGRRLLENNNNPARSHRDFEYWANDVAKWLYS